ncbi:hypothetical protein PLESTM_002023300 [Pleodorina starrii]|nr:hypothetical protein PLESTM_002023300 [Pleodorina starrii]
MSGNSGIKIHRGRLASLPDIPRRLVNSFPQLCALYGITGDLESSLYAHITLGTELSPSAVKALRARPRSRVLLEALKRARPPARADEAGPAACRPAAATAAAAAAAATTAAAGPGPAEKPPASDVTTAAADPEADELRALAAISSGSSSSSLGLDTSDEETLGNLGRLQVLRLRSVKANGYCRMYDIQPRMRLVKLLRIIFAAAADIPRIGDEAITALAEKVVELGYEVVTLAGEKPRPSVQELKGPRGSSADDSDGEVRPLHLRTEGSEGRVEGQGGCYPPEGWALGLGLGQPPDRRFLDADHHPSGPRTQPQQQQRQRLSASGLPAGAAAVATVSGLSLPVGSPEAQGGREGSSNTDGDGALAAVGAAAAGSANGAGQGAGDASSGGHLNGGAQPGGGVGGEGSNSGCDGDGTVTTTTDCAAACSNSRASPSGTSGRFSAGDGGGAAIIGSSKGGLGPYPLKAGEAERCPGDDEDSAAAAAAGGAGSGPGATVDDGTDGPPWVPSPPPPPPPPPPPAPPAEDLLRRILGALAWRDERKVLRLKLAAKPPRLKRLEDSSSDSNSDSASEPADGLREEGEEAPRRAGVVVVAAKTVEGNGEGGEKEEAQQQGRGRQQQQQQQRQGEGGKCTEAGEEREGQAREEEKGGEEGQGQGKDSAEAEAQAQGREEPEQQQQRQQEQREQSPSCGGGGGEGEVSEEVRQLWLQLRKDRAAGYIGAVLATAIQRLKFHLVLGSHRAMALRYWFRSLVRLTEDLVRPTLAEPLTAAAAEAAAAAGEVRVWPWLQIRSDVEGPAGNLRTMMQLATLRGAMRRHLVASLLQPLGHPDRQQWCQLAEHSIAWHMRGGPLAPVGPEEEAAALGRRRRRGRLACLTTWDEPWQQQQAQEQQAQQTGVSMRGEGIPGRKASGAGSGRCAAAEAEGCSAAGCGEGGGCSAGAGGAGGGGNVGCRGQDASALAPAPPDGAGPHASRGADAGGAAEAVVDDIGQPAAAAAVAAAAAAAAASTASGGSAVAASESCSEVCELVGWLAGELAPLWERLAQRALEAEVGRGGDSPALAGEFVELARLCQKAEGDWGIMTLLPEGPGGGGLGGGAEEGAGGAGAGGQQQQRKATRRHGRGGDGDGGGGCVAVVAEAAPRPVLARSRTLCAQLARRFEYRWPVAVVGSETLAALIYIHALYVRISLAHSIPMWMPTLLNPPPQSSTTTSPAAKRCSGDPYRPRPGSPPCVVLQWMGGRVKGLRFGGSLEEIRVNLQPGRSFYGVYCEAHRNVLRHGFAAFICDSIEDVQTAVCVSAKVRDDLQLYHLQETICFVQVTCSEQEGREWKNAYLQGGWLEAFRMVDDGRRPRLGRMEIYLAALRRRRGTSHLEAGLVSRPGRGGGRGRDREAARRELEELVEEAGEEEEGRRGARGVGGGQQRPGMRILRARR